MADILLTGNGFSSTVVSVSAQTDTGRKWLAYRGGSFCSSIQYRKSVIGDVLVELADWGCSTKWA
jgi:hypothetical protein